MNADDVIATLSVTLRPRSVLGTGGYEYETLDVAGCLVAEGWCSGTKEQAEAVAKRHAYRNIARRARKGRV